MPRSNDEVERALLEYADLLAILDEDRFKPRAYDKAARAIGGYPDDLRSLDDAGLRAIPGVGRSIAEKIRAFLETGSFPALVSLREQIPAGVKEMTAIPGFGPKKAMIVYRELGIDSLEGLVAAARDGRLASLRGFSSKTADAVLAGLARAVKDTGRVRIDEALEVADTFVDLFRAVPGVRRAEHAGSLRRMRDTIGDVDLLVASRAPEAVMDAFTGAGLVERVLAHGDRKSSILTRSGLQVDLRVVRLEAWGAAMIYFTGSKAHNVRIREMAVRAGLKLNEYGLFGKDEHELLVSRTEEDVYAHLGMAWVPPTMREDRGEIELALAHDLPNLVTLKDLRGDLHTHTDLTDGTASLERMLQAAAAKRYAYVAVTDHAPNLAMQRMTDEKMLAQRDRLRALQARYPSMILLHGTELNIGPDGGVDWPAAFLEAFDVTVAAVHSHFGLPRDRQTRRVIRAIENPHVHVIGHLTTRLINRREPIDLDLDAVFAAAGRAGTAIEIDAYPDRLDVNDELIWRAKRYGVRFAIDSDAHAVGHLDHLRFGVGAAQRAWLTRQDVINAWPLTKLRRFLRKGR